MAMITRFEDIQAWQEARKLVKMIYELTGSGTLTRDFGLRDQLQRAAVSSMANIALLKGLTVNQRQNLRVSLVSHADQQ
ncbi:MAG TPA: four helix bundle protein [Anaerolineales bacterium]|nr:four helix bundle protein [Anaerolineales bacterium]